MYITSLTLKNFRNYENETIEFSPLTNIIYGGNANGKTNILEAVYMFSHGRSHRAKSDKELIRFGEDFAKLSIGFTDEERSHIAKIHLQKNGKKAISINHVRIAKLSRLMNYLNVVMFSPEDLELVKGAPSIRRRFIDGAISQLRPSYLSSLIDYNKALVQKNSLLKDLKRRMKKSDPLLSVWNMQLAENGAKIMRERLEFVDKLKQIAKQIQSEISKEALEISYLPSIKTEEITTESLLEYLEAHQAKEIEFASSSAGIQRDDLLINVNSRDAKTYGSQGQQRTSALSLKIALADYIKQVKDEYPVLLLDDIMSELDINRRMYLSEKIKDKQVLITGTDTDLMESTDETRLFHIHDGRVI